MDDSREPDGSGGVNNREPVVPDPALADLLERIRAGDGDAFEQVARQEAPRLFRLALRLCPQRADAEDLVQETLVHALPRLPRFEGRAKLSTYLTRALGNRFKNRLRSRSRSKLVDWFRGLGGRRDEAPPEPAADQPTVHERMEADERALAVRGAVQQLEPTRRWTLLLREVEELSYEEIAQVTGVAVGTVRSRLSRAKDDLRKILESAP